MSIVDFARRQNGAAQPTSHGIIPMQDFAGWSKSGKTYGYAGIPFRMLRLSNSQNKKYIIGAGSVESEAGLIDQTKWTTMPVIFDDSDFLTESEDSISSSKGGGGGKHAIIEDPDGHLISLAEIKSKGDEGFGLIGFFGAE